MASKADLDDPDAAVTVALPQIVGGLARELGQIAELADSLQSVVGLDRSIDAEDGAVLKAAQGLDLLTQKIEALHCFTRVLAEIVPADCRVDPTPATRAITLTSVRERLSGSERPADAVAGDAEFF